MFNQAPKIAGVCLCPVCGLATGQPTVLANLLDDGSVSCVTCGQTSLAKNMQNTTQFARLLAAPSDQREFVASLIGFENKSLCGHPLLVLYNDDILRYIQPQDSFAVSFRSPTDPNAEEVALDLTLSGPGLPQEKNARPSSEKDYKNCPWLVAALGKCLAGWGFHVTFEGVTDRGPGRSYRYIHFERASGESARLSWRYQFGCV